MPIRRPSEILGDLNKSRQDVLDRSISKISETLESKFTGEPVEIWIYHEISVTESVFPQICNELAPHWSAKITQRMNSQRDGSGIRITVSPVEGAT